MRVGWSEVFGLATRRESKSNTQNNVIRSKQKKTKKRTGAILNSVYPRRVIVAIRSRTGF